MATLQQQVFQQVINDPRSMKTNVPQSDRTFFEMLSDPSVGDIIKQDVVDSFNRTYVKAPPISGQEIRALPTDDPRYLPPEAPAGGLQAGETVNPDGSINYSPALEATKSQQLIINLGSLVGGTMTPEGSFLPGPSRPGSPSFTFNLPIGMRPDEVTADVFDKIIKVVRKEAPEEYQAAKEYESAFVSFGKAGAREGVLGIPSLLDMPGLALRALDYVVSPIGTNTLSQDIYQPIRKTFGLSDTRPRPSSPYQVDIPRLFEAGGLYSTEYHNALYQGAVVIDPSRELMPVHAATGKLLDEVLANLGAPNLLTPQQETETQRTATFFGNLFGGSLTTSGAFRLGAKAVVKGMKVEDLQDATTLNRFLYSVANSPGADFAVGKTTRRRFTIPGSPLFIAKDLGMAGVSGAAMHLTPDEWAPNGKMVMGLTAPLALSKAISAVTAVTKGQGVPMLSGFWEPFTPEGQQRLAARYVASIPGIKGNEPLVVKLLTDLENIPTKPGQDSLVSTPTYFSTVSDEMGQAAKAWSDLRSRGVSDADAIAQLSQNAVYGKYVNGGIPVFGQKTPSIEALNETGTALKVISDNMYGAMSWLQTGSPIKNEVLRSAGDRLKVAEQTFRDLSRNFDADPGAASAYVQDSVRRLTELADDALATHATDALLYNQLKEMIGNPEALARGQIATAERAIEGVQNAFREAREIERALWTDIGATQIDVAPQNMALIGDKAAEIILSTPVAQRKQIPSILFEVAGKNRLLSDEALEAMAKSAGASTETPVAIRNARAKIAELQARQVEIESRPYQDPNLAKAQAKLSRLEAELAAIPKGRTIEDASVIGRINRKQVEIAGLRRVIDDLSGDTVNPALTKVNDDIAGQRAKLKSLEDEIVPLTAAGDEAVKMGPNGILDNVNNLDQVLALRGVLLDASARLGSRTGGKNSARIANEAQSYIIDDWLQDPSIFGAAGKTAAYDAARTFSGELNTKYTRGPISDYLANAADRGSKVDHNQFLAQIIKSSSVGPGRVPSGSLDAFDASLVEAKSPYLIRSEDGTITVDPDAALTPGLEGVTWESIRTAGPDSAKLSSQLLREEVLNQLALVAFDSHGVLNPQKVQKAVRSWALPIAKIEESYPGFGKEIQDLAISGEQLALRNKVLHDPSRKTIDEALATQNLDDLASVKDAGDIVRKIQADRSSASIFLDKDPRVVAATLFADPASFETNIAATLKILDADDTGAARAGFQRSIFDELMRRTLPDPSTAGRMPGESVLDPSQINQLLTRNEQALRQIFSDRVGPPGSSMTTYDMLTIFNDEISLAMAERAGKAAGAASEPVKLTFRGGEAIRNLGRILGVRIAALTGGPALVMAGTGGRLAGRIFESGGNQAIFSLVADALADPSLAKILLTETASLSKKGKFVFDKRLTRALRPYRFMAGPPTQVIREGVEEQKEIDRVNREGGETEIYYDEGPNQYARRPAGMGDRSSVRPAGPPPRRMGADMQLRPPVPSSSLSQASGTGQAPAPTGQQPAAPPGPAGPPSPDVVQQGQQLFGANDSVFGPGFRHGGYVAGGAGSGAGRMEKSGIMSVPRKPRQLVG
jgi:hypothetical protein